MKTTSSVEYTYLGYLHHQVFNEKSWLWKSEICKGAAKLALIHPSFASGTPILTLSPALRDIQIKTLHASFAMNTAFPQASLKQEASTGPIKKFFSITLLLSTL